MEMRQHGFQLRWDDPSGAYQYISTKSEFFAAHIIFEEFDETAE